MAILNTLIASSALALTFLAQAATPVNALAAPVHGNHARHAVSPNHNGMIKRKRNTHKNRKRCIASQQNLGNTDTSNTNNGNNNPSSSQGSSDSTYTPPATNNNNNSGNNNPSAPTCSGGKIGLAWDWQLSNDWIPGATTGKTCWLYNWSPAAPSAAQLGALKFVPMYWGPGGDHEQSFSDNVVNSNTNYGLALAMNEVNEPTQSNLDIWTGAALWRQWLLPLRQNKGYYIISPSTTSAPTGIQWMQGWLGQLGGDELPNALALHWYGTSFNDFQGYVTSFHNAFPGYKLWITEFACTDFSGQGIWCDVPSFAAQAAAWIAQQDYIEAAFPFGFVTSMVGVQEENRLIYDGGALTNVGKEYLY